MFKAVLIYKDFTYFVLVLHITRTTKEIFLTDNLVSLSYYADLTSAIIIEMFVSNVVDFSLKFWDGD